MKVFVFDSERAHLALHSSPQAALAGREPAALKAQRWLFFALDGSGLRVDCHADGTQHLRPWASCSSCTLAQLLPYVQQLGEGLSLQGLREQFCSPARD
jgi:hypothetical protein